MVCGRTLLSENSQNLSFLLWVCTKMGISVKDLRSKAELDDVVKDGTAVALHFWASWCPASAQMDVVFAQLCSDNPHARFFRVEAEEAHEISEAFQVSAVPFFVFIKDGGVVTTLEGANPAELANRVAQLAVLPGQLKKSTPADTGVGQESTGQNGTIHTHSEAFLAKDTKAAEPLESSDTLKSKLQGIVASNPVMLFMKGTPEEPRCGFSRRVVGILNELGLDFGTFDILSDEEVRQGMKSFSNWPTYPQLYITGEFIGGCDIITEMHKSGELKDVLAEKGVQAKQSMEDKLKTLINLSPTMLFMKGTPDAPRCGFSSKVVNALKEEGINFGSFDILSDDEVRQGLKTFSNWPTYPQLYHNGELIGGCDIILEMKGSGELKSALT